MKIGGFQLRSIGHWLGKNKIKIGAVLAAGLLVLQLIPSAPTSAQGNLIGYWKFDEADAGNTAVDSSGRGNNAEPTNDPAPSNDVPDAMDEAFADPHSVSFDGSTQYFTAGNDGSFDNTDAVSISVWVKFDTVNNTNQTIIGRWHVGKHQQWVLQLNSSNKIGFWTGDGSTEADNLESANTVSADTWYHIVATATDGAKELYINGQPSNSNTAGSMGLAAAADVTIGSKLSDEDSFFEFLDGKLDDLRVYDRVLSAGEIAELAVGSQTSAVWTGSVSSDWHTADNWNIDAVPDAHTNVTIPKTATHPVLTQATAAAKVTVSSGGILDLNGFDLTTNDSNVTVVGTLISKNTESSTNIDATYGTIMYKHTDNATGLVFGNDYHNLILNDGLVGYWPLDETTAGSTAVDRSGYGSDATPTGDPTPSTDVASNIKFINSRSLDFDGSNYLSVPDAPHLDLTDQLTIAAWVKPASLEQQMQIVAKSDENDTPATYALYIDSSGRPAFQLHDGDSLNVITGDSAVQANEWTHVAGVYNGSSMFLYVNGAEAATAPMDAPAANDSPLTIGGFSDAQKFNGLIDDVRVYNRALGSDEVERLGNGEQPATTAATTTLNNDLNIGQSPAIGSGLIGYWPMDESSAGSPVADISGKGNDGTPVGSPQPSLERPPQIAASQNPYSLSFDGNNYVNLGADAGDITTGDFTLSTWFKTSYTGGFQYFMSKRNGSVGYEIGIESAAPNEGKIYIYFGDGNGPSVSWRVSTKDYRDGEWHHLAVTFDRDGNAQVYVDGSATGSPVDISGHQGSLSIASPLVFGEYYANHNQRLVGNLDDARIYDRVLSADDISQLYGGNLGLDGAGSLTLNSGTLDVSESNYTINLAGDFENNGGVLEPQQGTVNLTGGNQIINSSNTFYNLIKDISSGFDESQTLTFGAGSTTTIGNDLTLTGASGVTLVLASSAPDKAWGISIGGTAALAYLTVSDSNNTGATLTPTDSTDDGGNTNWNFNAPDAPNNLGPEDYTDGSFGTDTTPTLTFDLSDPDAGTEVGYQIQIDDDSDFSSPVVDYTSALAAQGSFGFTVGQEAGDGSYATGSSSQTLSDGAYYWRVKAIDVGGHESAYVAANGGSAAFSIDTTGPTTPGQPSPAASPTTDTTPSWSWAASTDDGAGLGSPAYTVEWSQDSNFDTVTDSATTNDTTFTHSDELGDGTWYLRIKAVDDLGNESDWSDAGSVLVDTTAPTKPGTPTATSPTSDTTPTVSWNASEDSGSGLGDPAYTLEWSDDPTFADGADDSLTTNDTNATPGPLSDGTWYFRVIATDGVGNTNTSDVSSGIVIDSTGPTAPGKPTATSPTSDTTPTVSWSASEDSGAGLKDPTYRLEWSDSATFDGGADGSLTTNDTSASPSSPLADGTWYFRVIAADALDNTTASPISDGILIDTTEPTKPGTPSTPSPTDDTTPTWTWDASTDDGTGLGDPAYTLEWSQAADFSSVTGSASAASNTYTHTVALVDGTWYFRVKAEDAVGNESEWSDAGSVVVDAVAPTAPQNFQLTTPSPTNAANIGFSWDASSDSGTGLGDPAYTLVWCNNIDCDDETDSLTTNDTSASPALPEGTWYVHVFATDGMGHESDNSDTVSVVVDRTGPTSPGKPTFTQTPTTDATPELSWNASSDDLGLDDPAYTLEWSDDETFDGGPAGSTSTNGTSASPDSDLADGTWYFRVVVSDQIGNTTTSPVSDAILIDTTPPTKPGKPTTPSPTSNRTPTWTWAASTDDGSGLADPTYYIEWSQDPFLITDVETTTTNDTTFTHTDELADGEWYFRVIAYDNVGLSTNSDVAIVEISADAPAISNVSATPGDDPTKMVITWTTSKEASSEVWYGPTANLGATTPETDTDPRVINHSVTLTDLVPCSIYHFVVRSEDALGNTGGSADQTFVTTGCAGDANVLDHATETVDPLAGGSLNLETISLTIPAGYSGDTADFQIKQINASNATGATGAPNGLVLASNKVYDIKALIDQETTVNSFNEPITVTISYTDLEIVDLVESSLWIYRWNSGTGWQPLDDCVVDEDANTVTCTTASFSTFALYGTEKPSEQENEEEEEEGQESNNNGNSGDGTSDDSSNQPSGNTETPPGDRSDTPVSNTSEEDQPAGSDNQNNDGREPAGTDAEEDDPVTITTVSDSSNNNWWWLLALALVVMIWLIAAKRRRKDSSER